MPCSLSRFAAGLALEPSPPPPPPPSYPLLPPNPWRLVRLNLGRKTSSGRNTFESEHWGFCLPGPGLGCPHAGLTSCPAVTAHTLQSLGPVRPGQGAQPVGGCFRPRFRAGAGAGAAGAGCGGCSALGTSQRPCRCPWVKRVQGLRFLSRASTEVQLQISQNTPDVALAG